MNELEGLLANFKWVDFYSHEVIKKDYVNAYKLINYDGKYNEYRRAYQDDNEDIEADEEALSVFILNLLSKYNL
jgi:hypothetical protein